MSALRHRIPVRLRQHWKPTALLAATVTVLLVFLGGARISPLVASASAAEGDVIANDIPGTVDLYDPSVAHSIELTYDEDAYRALAEAYEEDGEKEYIQAEATIDGTPVGTVGIRLKGNSTLQSLRGADGPGGTREGGRDGGQGALPVRPDRETAAGAGADAALPPGAGGGFGGGGPGGLSLSFDSPEELPWLIKVDEYQEGLAYQGHQTIAVRPGTGEGLPVNEALSLELTAGSGQQAQEYAFSAFTVNGQATATRLIVENPDLDYAADLGDGVLYKARAGGSFSYQGEDPTQYEDDFQQVTMKGSQDLQPVIDFIRWLEDADGAAFDAGLDDWLDLESFARYTASQNLLLNADDMAGLGSNYYLWYDLDTAKFTVLSWDFNLTMSGDATTGPDEELTMGGGRAGGGNAAGTGDDGAAGGGPDAGGTGEGEAAGTGAAGREGPPAESGTPGGAGTSGDSDSAGAGAGGNGASDGTGPAAGAPTEDPPPGGAAGGFPGGAGGGGGMGMGGHPLKERFLASDAFADLYDDAYAQLYESYYASGTALGVLDALTAAAEAADADADSLAAVVARLRETVSSRTASLSEALGR